MRTVIIYANRDKGVRILGIERKKSTGKSAGKKKSKKQIKNSTIIPIKKPVVETPAHEHHGFLHWVKEKYYNKYWLPWLIKVNNWTGGRAHAGEVARRARLIRIAMNVLSIAAILSFIFITGGLSAGAFVSFWNTGSELPLSTTVGLVAATVTMFSMVVNMFEVQIGTAANFAKIQQYTHAELANQEWLNEKRNEKIQIPHFWDSPFDKKVMLFVRYAHDFNGLVGSAMSSYLFMACAVSVFTPWSLPLSLLGASVLFVASRASSLASVTLAPFTNQLRLSYYKKRLDAQADEYYLLHFKANPKHEALIKMIIERSFNQTIQGQIPKLHSRVKFLCYRACEAAIGEETLDARDIDLKVILVRSVIEEHFKAAKPEDVSYFENLYLLGAKLEDRLKSVSVKHPDIRQDLAANHSELRARYPERLLEQELCANVSHANKESVLKNMTESPYLVSRAGRPYEINQKKAVEDFPLKCNTHGEEFVPAYHCEKIVQSLVRAK